jgi:hypothetical protein
MTTTSPQPLRILSYGLGLDSTAAACLMHLQGIRPDIIVFADTGGEKPETYAYLAVFNAWLRSVGFPEVDVVRYEPVRASYTTLEAKSLANENLLSLSFRGHECALVFKREPITKFLKAHPLVIAAIESGRPIHKIIGYDDSPADRKRSEKTTKTRLKMLEQVQERLDCGKTPLASQWEVAHLTNVYMLQDQGLSRPMLPAIVESVGLPVPVKSACFYCPASRPEEVVQLRLDHPDLFDRALTIERNAQEGKHKIKQGLSIGQWHWAWLSDCTDPSQAAAVIKARTGKDVKEGLRP